MKKIFLILMTLTVILLLPLRVYADTTVSIPVRAESPVSVSLVRDGETLETKDIKDKDEFILTFDDVGVYRYELKSKDKSYKADVYIMNDGDSVIIYDGEEKQEAVFGEVSEETTPTTPTTTTPPPPEKTTVTKTGDDSLMGLWIGLACGCAGIVILLTVLLVKRKR